LSPEWSGPVDAIDSSPRARGDLLFACVEFPNRGSEGTLRARIGERAGSGDKPDTSAR